MENPTWSHEGVEISITIDGQFAYGGSDDTLPKHFDSLSQAKEAIDQTIRAERATQDINLSILGNDGKEYKLRRIHAGSGSWLFSPSIKYDGDKPRRAYYPCDKSRDLLRQRQAAEDELRRLQALLSLGEILLRGAAFYQYPDKSEVIQEAYQEVQEAYDKSRAYFEELAEAEKEQE